MEYFTCIRQKSRIKSVKIVIHKVYSWRKKSFALQYDAKFIFGFICWFYIDLYDITLSGRIVHQLRKIYSADSVCNFWMCVHQHTHTFDENDLKFKFQCYNWMCESSQRERENERDLLWNGFEIKMMNVESGEALYPNRARFKEISFSS